MSDKKWCPLIDTRHSITAVCLDTSTQVLSSTVRESFVMAEVLGRICLTTCIYYGKWYMNSHVLMGMTCMHQQWCPGRFSHLRIKWPGNLPWINVDGHMQDQDWKLFTCPLLHVTPCHTFARCAQTICVLYFEFLCTYDAGCKQL